MEFLSNITDGSWTIRCLCTVLVPMGRITNNTKYQKVYIVKN